MPRTASAACAAVAGFFGASVAAVVLLEDGTRPAALPAAAAEPAPRPDAPAPPPPPAPRAAPAGRAAAGPPAGASARRRAYHPGIPGDAAVVAPVADRLARRGVQRALLEPGVQARLASCGRSDGGAGVGAGTGRAPGVRPAALTLELEPLAGAIRIAEARPRAFGGASAEAVECACAALRGLVVPAVGAAPGERVQMPWILQLRGGAVTSGAVTAP